jgi:hypothetical protein
MFFNKFFDKYSDSSTFHCGAYVARSTVEPDSTMWVVDKSSTKMKMKNQRNTLAIVDVKRTCTHIIPDTIPNGPQPATSLKEKGIRNGAEKRKSSNTAKLSYLN